MSDPAPLNLPLLSYEQRPGLYRALRQAQRQPDRPDFTPADAERLNDLVAPLMLVVPPVALSPSERARLGGATFLESAALAWRTGRALIGDAQAFPGAAPVGESLQFRAQRALTLRGISAVLTTLARRLDDLALMDLASATRDATAIHKAVEADAASPRFGLHHLAQARLSRARRALAPHRRPR